MLVLSFIMTLASCKDHDEPEHIADKTILIYMPYTGSSGNLYNDFQKNISDIKASLEVNGFGNNNVLAFICKNAYTAHLIQFRKNSKHGEAIINDTLQTFQSPAITTKEGISEILTEVKNIAPAEKYGMIVGAHGQGWLPAEGTTPKKSRYFGSGTVGYQTNLSTLVEALEETGTHLQFALFDCCYMACIENVYEMRNVVDYYIASTSEIMNFGMPYNKLFHSLMLKEPDYARVVDEFNNFYSTYEMPYGALCVTNCKLADEMASLMLQINASSGFKEASESREVISNVQDLDAGYFTPTIYYDFGSYVEHCCKDENLLNQYRNLINSFVPYKKSTEYILSGVPLQYTQVKEFSGLTISDPSTNERVKDSKLETPWWKATHY